MSDNDFIIVDSEEKENADSGEKKTIDFREVNADGGREDISSEENINEAEKAEVVPAETKEALMQ